MRQLRIPRPCEVLNAKVDHPFGRRHVHPNSRIARSHSSFSAAVAERQRRVLSPLIAVMDHLLRPALTDSHLEGVQHELGAQMVCHRPADDLAAPGVEHDGQVEEPDRGWHIRDVGDPQPVRAIRGEVAIDQVRCRTALFVTTGCDRTAMAMAGAGQPRSPHQASDPLAAVLLAAGPQFSVHSRCTVGLARPRMDALHAREQHRVGLGTHRRRPLQPGMEACLRHAEHTCHGGDREAGLVRAHEPEDPDGIAPVSRTNQAAAFDKISRSSLS